MENVEGLLMGEAWSYVQEIYRQFKEIGYQVKHWLCKGENMGVPQKRHRVFFIALRSEVKYHLTDLDMSFNYEPITYGDIKGGSVAPLGEGTDYHRLTLAALPHEKNIADVNLRLHNKNSGFQSIFVDDSSILPTLRAKPDIIDRKEVAYVSRETLIHAQTFPEDYDFVRNTMTNAQYILGMSVPPIMIKRIVQRLIESGVL
jgi:DNA (cytosine-5)-methyltransferase 1